MKITGFLCHSFLREIHLGESRSYKNAVFAILAALNFVDLVYYYRLQSSKSAKIHTKSKFRYSKCAKMADFAVLASPKLISRKNVKNKDFSLTKKIFRKINSLRTLISRNFCQKSVRDNFRNFHTVHSYCQRPLEEWHL